MKVEFYTKSNCSLCDDVRELLFELSHEIYFTWIQTDITEHLALYETLRYEVPVVKINGTHQLSLHISRGQLKSALLLASNVPSQ
jgi:glutaredoxin